MQTRTLQTRKNGPLDLSLLGFGGAPLANLYHAISDAEAQSTLDAAFAAGITYYDTSPFYGLGRSEERFGTALKGWSRDKVVISTKIGRVLEDCAPEDMIAQTQFIDEPHRKFRFDYSYDGLMASFEQSLKRLGTDYIDILYVHDIDIWTHGSKAASDARINELFDDGGYRALEELRAAGTIKAFGAGVNEWKICETLAGRGDFDCFLLAGRYTLLEQGAQDSFLPDCQKRGTSIILGGPYNSGILATGAVPGAKYNYNDASPEILERTRALEAVCAAHNVALVEAALHFVLAHPVMVSVIPGGLGPEDVARNIEVLSARIPAKLWDDLKAEKLIGADSPVPTGTFD